MTINRKLHCQHLKSPSSQHQVVRGAALDALREIDDSSVDLILTDPPYNLAQYSTGNIRPGWRKSFNNDIADWDLIKFDPSMYVEEFTRVLKPTGNLFAFTSYNLLGNWHSAFDPLFDTFQFMVWHKTNPPPKFRRAGFLNSCELIVCMWDKGHTWNFSTQKEMHNFFESPVCGGKERLKEPHHPTQKPVRLLSRLIEIASMPDDLVLDPFAGVGSTAIAAERMGRRSISVEIDETYARAIISRLGHDSRSAIV